MVKDGNGGQVSLLPIERNQLLTKWRDLNAQLYVKLKSEAIIAPTWDDRQPGDTRLSSVQYLCFGTK